MKGMSWAEGSIYEQGGSPYTRTNDFEFSGTDTVVGETTIAGVTGYQGTGHGSWVSFKVVEFFDDNNVQRSEPLPDETNVIFCRRITKAALNATAWDSRFTYIINFFFW